MDLGIQKKTALVMSSSMCLGEGIAKSLASEGVHVLLSSRNKDRLSEIVNEIEAAGGQADFVVADLVDPSSVNTIQLAARKLLGQIDIFIANTGGPPPGGGNSSRVGASSPAPAVVTSRGTPVAGATEVGGAIMIGRAAVPTYD